MDLQEPTAKMSKSTASEAGVISLYDDPAAIVKKFKRAVTDSGSEVRFDRAEKPGVSNLLEIQSAATGRSPEDIADRLHAVRPAQGGHGRGRRRAPPARSRSATAS